MEIKANPVHPNAASAPTKNAQTDSAGFTKILNDVIKPKPVQEIEAQPAALCRLIKPRSHLKLTSLNPISGPSTPKPAALERIGESRILPFVLSTTR